MNDKTNTPPPSAHVMGSALTCQCANTITDPCIVCGKGKTLVTAEWLQKMAAKEGDLDPTTGWEAEEKLTVEEAWTILCETPDVTSPEEYPDHALITMEQLGSFMARAAPQTLTKEFAHRLFDLHGFMLLETYKGKHAVTVTFPDLAEAQQFHGALVELSTHRPRPQSLAEYAAQSQEGEE